MLVRHSSLSVMLMTLFAFTACKKEEKPPDCDSIALPSVRMKTALKAGDTLFFHADIPGQPSFHMWYGPNRFNTTDTAPMLPNVNAKVAGVYTLKVTYPGGCTKTVTTAPVTVTIPPPPCTASNNTASLSDTASWDLTAIEGRLLTGMYQLTATSPRGTLILQFAGAEVPVGGIYQIQPFGLGGGQFRPGALRFRIQENSNLWLAATGEVNVNVVNGKTVLVFCSVPLNEQNSPRRLRIRGKITIP